MKSRSNKLRRDRVASKATGRIGAFPYHRAVEQVKREQKTKAALTEREQKGKLTKGLG